MDSRSISKDGFFDRLYEVGENFDPGALRVAFRGRSGDEAYRIATSAFRGEPQDAPIELCQREGSIATDWIGGTTVALKLVSARICEILDRSRITGWSTYPVTITRNDGTQVTGYAGLAVLGRCGARQRHGTPTQSLNGPSDDGSLRKGFYFDEGSWDGSDVFSPVGTTFVFVVERVKKLLEEAGATNVSFISLSELDP